MSYQQEIKNFSYKLHNSAIELDTFKETGFAHACCQILSDSGVIDNYEVLYFKKSTQFKINGYAIDDERENLDLFVCHFEDSINPVKVDPGGLRLSSRMLVNFFKESLKSLSGKLPKNTDAYSVARLIKDSHKKINRARLYVFTNALGESKIILTEKISGIDVTIEFFDLSKLYNLTLVGNVTENISLKFDLEVDRIECVKSATNPKDIETYLAIIPGETLYRLYEAWGSQLLELNVRSFLQVSGKINKGIRTTLLDEPNMFFAYNNGIATTAEKIKFVKGNDGKNYISEITGFQIVNGGQTTASIHRAKKVDNVDLSNISVATKITVVQKENIRKVVPLISRYSNSQNAVKQSDFHSDNIYHKKIEEMSKKIFIPGESGRWFFERKAGEFQNEKFRHSSNSDSKKRFNSLMPVQRKFSKENIARYINSWEELPHIVCTGVQKNFIYFMNNHAVDAVKEKIIDDEYYKNVIAQAILFRSVEKLIKESNISAYRSQVCTYTVSVLSKLTGKNFNFSPIWQDQEISNELEEIILVWVEKIYEKLRNSADRKNKNPSEWFKKLDCWKELKNTNIVLPKTSVPIELKGTKILSKSKSKFTIDDEYKENMRKCKSISPKGWLKIAQFVQENEDLRKEFHGMCLTLKDMANDEWYEDPTPNIAKEASAIVDLAVEENIIKV